MPFRKRLARFNKHVTNRVARRFAGWMPGFAIVRHVGRRSGRTYRTPVNVETRGKTIALRNPQRFSDPSRGRVPRPVRGILGLLHVEDFLAMERA